MNKSTDTLAVILTDKLHARKMLHVGKMPSWGPSEKMHTEVAVSEDPPSWRSPRVVSSRGETLLLESNVACIVPGFSYISNAHGVEIRSAIGANQVCLKSFSLIFYVSLSCD